jgi:glycerol-3-phosphate O-acyltransferase/dihydroxyacetone phosphate acyltransferase
LQASPCEYPPVLASLVRRLSEALVRLYYPDRRVEHGERLPGSGPVIFVLNHPNGLLDPMVLAVTVGRPVRFLAKSTLFNNPLGRLAMRAFGCVPVYRAQDGGMPDRAAANEATFARCRALLAQGEALALFPEGVSHSDPQLKPLKTGAARIALSAERERGGGLGLQVVPVGLAYEAKTIFRSRVLLVVGEPIRVADRLGPPGDRQAEAKSLTDDDERAQADRLTDDIRAALDEVVLQAESRDLLEGVARVAAWTAASPPDPGEQQRRAHELLDAYHTLSARAPEQVEPIVRAARDYARVLRRLGVRDPWALELEPVRPGVALGALARLLFAAPAALLGALLGWIPYRLAGRVAQRMTRDEDVLGTVKLLTGALFLLVFWLAEATIAALTAGPPWGLLAFVAGPACGYVALRFDEILSATTESARHLWLRATRPGHVLRLADRRRALAHDIARALRKSSS